MKILILNLLYLIIQCQPNERQTSGDHYHSSESSFYDEGHNNHNSNDDGRGFQEFTIFLIIGVLALALPNLYQSWTEDSAAINRNKNNLDELNQKINSLAQKLQEGNLEMSFTFNDEWIQLQIEKVSVQQNENILNFEMYGSDCYGSWTKSGVININKNSQIETSFKKIYANAKLQKGDELIYEGQFDEQNQSIKGHWQYVRSKERGQWLLRLK
ncbi:unnamed protein product (macronuclear) [Paramecium tetraurelia]|uniref:Uncharacterized protein n=1 Tax=Paramecium tetraurelia TaxID=5888 RepID=A0D632_PARTE|nr:uncharacterized protein GSPATT00013929001 [Paramecium tetraurelia]CAK78499.1 unnamed protein product [Paramecium tetraurelia]|eukprot:XP_001445896.1 hypothetical protein (macronuclear) [Paramecium tetraurelia strain d4-2]